MRSSPNRDSCGWKDRWSSRPAGGEAIDLLLSVVPATGATLQPTQLRLAGKAERNKRLDVTLWITSGYPVIGVEIDVAPIDREQEGDWGIWE